MSLGLVIPGVGEVVGAFGRRDRIEDRSDRIVDGLGGSLCGFSEPVFELGEELLDRVQIGRVFWQVEELGAGGTNGATHGVGLVRAEIVHDDDVAVPQGRYQDLLDVEKESFAVDWTLEEPGSCDAIVAQSGHEGHSLPAAVRHFGFDALAARRPAPQRRHIGFSPGLIDEHQPSGIDPIPILGPLRPPTGDIGTILLGGNQRLFL
jgi:hypothetical protein